MNVTKWVTMGLSVGILAVAAGCMTEKHEAKLEAEARISRAEAQSIALSKVPGGAVKEGELEKEKGRLIWSFDLSTPGTTDITEVNIDAKTGEIVSTEKESASKEARERKKDKDDDDKDDKK